MAAKRRQSARTRRTTSRRSSRYDETTQVSFIGTEIRNAIERIQRLAAELPKEGRLAARVATTTLRLCSLRIQKAVDCDFWVLR